MTPESERTWATLLHLCGLLSILSGFPFAGLIAVIVMWVLKKEESAFVDEHGREALNFQISLAIYALAQAVGGLVLAIVTVGLAIPLLVLAWLGLVVLNLYGSIMAAVAANRGAGYRYPMSLRLIMAAGPGGA